MKQATYTLTSGHRLIVTVLRTSYMRRYDRRTGGVRIQVFQDPATEWVLEDPEGNIVSVGCNQQIDPADVVTLCEQMITSNTFRHHFTGTIGVPA
jgi:hypothetical protein